ncbi:peptidoglycan DD-metalloendopeptidase family protein [Thalassomonas actiniarum]|uniref:Peptidoglycan DD-metalloendopeptidase family protein n=1 Tax=Thalassomonas actiniarum TaxID=485447 RepID=A0AAF0C2F9_9GAMM|nr:peptidoglycan DD-metalloendopeptidase family protein [Thalassomonas actiniarum]WDE00057.1 peptidoglycan DD-metalloendopeptidase family protein [Thalassomonas actiniarum]
MTDIIKEILNFNRSSAAVFFCCLLLSACSSRQTPAPVADVHGSVPLKQRVKNSISATEYQVKKGETLYSIAWRANLDVRKLAQINKISAPYKIFPGQKLILTPKVTKASKVAASAKKSTKNSGKTIAKVVKKPVAPIKKQAYGKSASEQKLSKKSTLPQNSYSQKIREWRWPAVGKVIAKFSTAPQGNKGIDIAGRRGNAVKAAAAGKVVYAGNALRGYGNLIIVKHNDDYLSAYAHNDQIKVKEQQLVKAGDVIANMGDTESERVMLHFEVRFRGKSVNPLKYLPKK